MFARRTTDSALGPHILVFAMPKITHARISKASVDKMQPGEMLRDSDLTGFGVRRQSGAPVYFLQKRLNGTSRWFTIGAHGSPWTPSWRAGKPFV